ncbi:hypothetical protein G6F57_023395 [Rhizopus arrhizus]|nr:hypothetical protein G6F57_023395 [Rhizopus arrhizus]
MVEQQIRPWDVLDANVLQALFDVRREQFVPPALRALAFSDLELPLEINAVNTRQTMLAPKVEARLAQELQPRCWAIWPHRSPRLQSTAAS